MKFQNFRKLITDISIFRLNDIRKINPGFHQPQLMDWLNRGYIRSFAGEFYYIPKKEVD